MGRRLLLVCFEGLGSDSHRVLVVLYADHVRFHPCHPYIESLQTL